MPAKRGRKWSARKDKTVPPPPPPPEGEEAPAEDPVEPAETTPTGSPQEELPDQPTTQKRARVARTTTSYSDLQKEDIIEFLKANPSLYEKRRADYKNTQAKEILWQQQADMMDTTVNELKTWYNSHRTKLGRLKQAIKKSGQGAEGFSATDQWVWDNFRFLVPHIVETERRNVVSFKSKLISDTDLSTCNASPVVLQSSSEAECDTPAPNPPLPIPPTLPTPVHDETVAIGNMLKEFLAKKSTASPSTAGASYFALYVESTLKQLSGALRREAEYRIQQVLHDVEDKAERQRSQQEVTQQQYQQQQNQPQSQVYQNWQPQPSQWPTQLQGQTPSVWHSQDRQWMRNQFPQQRYTSPPPMTSSFGTRATEPQTCTSVAQGKTYSELQLLQRSQSETNLSSFSSSFLDRMTASTPLKPVGEDGINQPILDLSAVARDSDIPRELENDLQ